jgi:hypothetical protein
MVKAVKVFNGLPYKLKVISSDAREFKVKLKDFLYLNSFYTLECPLKLILELVTIKFCSRWAWLCRMTCRRMQMGRREIA